MKAQQVYGDTIDDKFDLSTAYIGKPGLAGRLRYRYYKWRGWVHGELWWKP